MIKFIFIHLFYTKKWWFLMGSMFLLFMLLFLFLQTGESIYEEHLFPMIYQTQTYDLSFKMITIILPFILIMFTLDHDQMYLKILTSYFGRHKVIWSKIIVYVLTIILIYSSLWIYHELLCGLMKPHLNYPFLLKDYMMLSLDGLLILVLVLYMARDKYKAFSILLGIFYMIYVFILEDHQELIFFYFFPIKNAYFETFTLAIPYKLCYISLGLILTYQKMMKEPYTSS